MLARSRIAANSGWSSSCLSSFAALCRARNENKNKPLKVQRNGRLSVKYERKQCGEERRGASRKCRYVSVCVNVSERVYTCLSRLWRFFSNTELGAAKKKIIVVVAAAVVVFSSADGNSYFSSCAIFNFFALARERFSYCTRHSALSSSLVWVSFACLTYAASVIHSHAHTYNRIHIKLISCRRLHLCCRSLVVFIW